MEDRPDSLRRHPVSRQWFRLLPERLDTVAALHHIAAQIADADPVRQPVQWTTTAAAPTT
ncbi:MAG: hypothetical protein OXK79_08340 [Chloroflexota bacterium]|nr:hypothetical protein [Chloroflexota bacterium]